ncbi:MAG: GIY-YIG nuclease family protein [Thiobacillus sp.]
MLGKIMVARFLEAPLGRVRGLVREIEPSPCFRRLEGLIVVGTVRDACVADCAEPPPGVLGKVAKLGNHTGFLYYDAAYAREYVFDDDALARYVDASREPALARLASRLRLVNTRNRLTHALVQTVLDMQAEYLESGSPLSLRPLSQAQVSATLRRNRSLPVVADEGRVSRLVRSLAIRLPGGKDVSMQTLFLSRRHDHCRLVAHVIKDEKDGLAEGTIEKPLTDGEIAEMVERKFGVQLLRRTVAYVRRDLGIPGCRERGKQGDYHVMISGFSAIFPLTPEALRTWAPRCPGVYEIRAGGGAPGTVYIGSAGNLRKRLADHLRGSGGNLQLKRIVAEGAGFRYWRVTNEWRVLEREVYRAFCKTYGTPPPCNRVSP